MAIWQRAQRLHTQKTCLCTALRSALAHAPCTHACQMTGALILRLGLGLCRTTYATALNYKIMTDNPPQVCATRTPSTDLMIAVLHICTRPCAWDASHAVAPALSTAPPCFGHCCTGRCKATFVALNAAQRKQQ